MPCDTIMRFKAIKQFQAETFFSKSNNIDTKFLKDEITILLFMRKGTLKEFTNEKMIPQKYDNKAVISQAF